MGKRIDLSQLAAENVLEAPVPQILDAPATPTRVPLATVTANPVNPRKTIGDLSDLESMRTVGQLQPCAVVTRAAFLAIYPEHSDRIGASDYVIVAGSRRRLAAARFDLPALDIVVRDVLATDRATFFAASVSENIDRRQLDVLEEAHAVQRLVDECGSGTRAGEILNKSKGWVSQRLALLKLSAQMQALLRADDLPIRDARRLAQLPEAEQLSTWETEQAAKRAFTAVNDDDEPVGAGEDPVAEEGQAPPSSNRSSTGRALATKIPPDADVPQIVDILGGILADDELEDLIAALTRVAQARRERLPR